MSIIWNISRNLNHFRCVSMWYKRWLTCTLFWWSAGSPRHWRSPRHKTSLWVQEKTFPFGGERRAAGRREAVSVLTCGRHHTKSIASDTLIVRWRLTNPRCPVRISSSTVCLSLTQLLCRCLQTCVRVALTDFSHLPCTTLSPQRDSLHTLRIAALEEIKENLQPWCCLVTTCKYHGITRPRGQLSKPKALCEVFIHFCPLIFPTNRPEVEDWRGS